MKKFIHIADTHIRNNEYHHEYNINFAKMYKQIKEEEPDCILHLGDIAHTKTSVSPEYFEMTRDFFENLANIAPVIIILGNHDGLIHNLSRQDSVTPVIETLNHPNITLLKRSCEYQFDEDVVFNVLSIFEEKDKWIKPTDKSKINIALYHGAVNGCSTDTNFVISNGDIDVSELEIYDFAMLGDIHKSHQKMDDDGRYLYAGSTIQQNFGETDDKGYVVWEIEDKNKWSTRHVSIPNPSPFITVDLDVHGNLVQNNIPENARIRINSYMRLNSHARNAKKREVQKLLNAKTVKYVSKIKNDNKSVLSEEFREKYKLSLREVSTQSDLIRSYLNTMEVSETIIQEVIELNKKYPVAIENEISRNVSWELKSLEWNNLFSYGTGNLLDFQRLKGVTGIFGKNYTGKSSSVEILMYSLYGKSSKNIRKSFDMINWNEDKANTIVEFYYSGELYRILRTSTKINEDRRTSKETVEFEVFQGSSWHSLNQEGKKETDLYIRNMIGTPQDFLSTSYMSQDIKENFVFKGSSDRKKIVARFLDLGIFESKFKLAKSKEKELKTLLKDEYRDSKKENMVELRDSIRSQQKEIKSLKQNLEIKEHEIKEANSKKQKNEILLSTLDAGYENQIVQSQNEIKKYKNEIISLRSEIKSVEEGILSYENLVIEGKKILENYSISEEETRIQVLSKAEASLNLLEQRLKSQRKSFDKNKELAKILDEVPCFGTGKFSGCQFLQKAKEAKDTLPEEKATIDEIAYSIKNLRKGSENLSALKSVLIQNKKVQTKLNNDLKNIEHLTEKKSWLTEKRKDVQQRLKALSEEYTKISSNKTFIEKSKKIKQIIREIEEQLQKLQKERKDIENSIIRHKVDIGKKEERIDSIASYERKRDSIKSEFEIIDLYLNCMHPNGISLIITNEMIPKINEEANSILSQLTDSMTVALNLDDRNLDILIEKEEGTGPVESSSGSQQAMIAMALRFALMKISTLPKSNVFVMDEPGTSFDKEHLTSLVTLMSLMQEEFDTVLLISHLDELKDAADNILNIVQEGKYPKLRN